MTTTQSTILPEALDPLPADAQATADKLSQLRPKPVVLETKCLGYAEETRLERNAGRVLPF